MSRARGLASPTRSSATKNSGRSRGEAWRCCAGAWNWRCASECCHNHITPHAKPPDEGGFLAARRRTTIMKTLELRRKRAALVEQARKILDAAEAEGRSLTAEEQQQWDKIMADVDALGQTIEREERLAV